MAEWDLVLSRSANFFEGYMVILISAKMGGGKTTLTNQILKAFPKYQVIKFADTLYEAHEKVWDVLEKYGVPREKKSRDFLQWLGTEFGRKRDKNIWVNCAIERMKSVNNGNCFIVDDCRFENEFDAFPDALRIRLECDRGIRKSRAESWTDSDQHPSETSLDAYAKGGAFHLYLDSGKRNSMEIFEIVSKAIKQQALGDDEFLAGGRIPDDFEELSEGIYKSWNI